LILLKTINESTERRFEFKLHKDEDVYPEHITLPQVPDYDFDQDIDTDEEACEGSKVQV